MTKAPKPKRKNGIPIPVGTLSKYFPVDSIPSQDIKRGPPHSDPVREAEAEGPFLSHNSEGGFRAFANLYTAVYLAKPKLVQGHLSPFPILIDKLTGVSRMPRSSPRRSMEIADSRNAP